MAMVKGTTSNKKCGFMIKKLSYFMVGFGFLWNMLFSIFGALLGARIHEALQRQDTVWMASWEERLMRSAHAHMGTCALMLIFMGLTLVPLQSVYPVGLLKVVAFGAMASVPVFGCGLIWQAWSGPVVDLWEGPTALSALGGIVYIVCVGVWGLGFVHKARRVR